MKKNYFLGLSKEGFHRVSYLEWGIADARSLPIICVHGMSRNARDFDELATYLSNAKRHVFCPDVIGRGDSDWLKDPRHYTTEQYLADLTTLIARTQAPQVDWIGTSMGGLLGMVLASFPHSPIRCLVLNDIGPHVPAKGLSRLATYINRKSTFDTLEEAKAYFKTILNSFGPLSEEQWQHLTENSVSTTSSGQLALKMDPHLTLSPSLRALLSRFAMHPIKSIRGGLFDMDLWDIWRKITCPVLVIHGSQSDILLPETVKKMQQLHPQTDVIEIADAGHAPALLEKAQHEMIYQWLLKHS